MVAGIGTIEEAANIVIAKAIQSRGEIESLQIIAQVADPKSAATEVKG